jgi:hypothetical protein
LQSAIELRTLFGGAWFFEFDCQRTVIESRRRSVGPSRIFDFAPNLLCDRVRQSRWSRTVLAQKPSGCRGTQHGETAQHASVADVEQLVAATGDLPWEQSKAVGEGEEYRAESKQGDHASALAFENVVVHRSVVVGV